MVPTMSTWGVRERLASHMEQFKEQLSDIMASKETSIGSFKLALAAGVTITTGTGADGSPVRHRFIAREVELMVENRMSPKDAIESSSRSATGLLGIQQDAGTIEVGKQGDLVPIDGDPHSDLCAMCGLYNRAVGKSGRGKGSGWKARTTLSSSRRRAEWRSLHSIVFSR